MCKLKNKNIKNNVVEIGGFHVLVISLKISTTSLQLFLVSHSPLEANNL